MIGDTFGRKETEIGSRLSALGRSPKAVASFCATDDEASEETSAIVVATTVKSASTGPRIADSDSTVNILTIRKTGEALPMAEVAQDD